MTARQSLAIGVNRHVVPDSAPPHEVVFKRNPDMFAWSIQQVPELVEILFSSRSLSVLSLELKFDCGDVFPFNDLVGYVVPPSVYLSVRMSRLPPTSAPSGSVPIRWKRTASAAARG